MHYHGERWVIGSIKPHEILISLFNKMLLIYAKLATITIYLYRIKSNFFKKSDKLYYLNLTPDHKLDSIEKCLVVPRLRHCYPSQCFYKKDLYPIFFGREINDEIAKKLFRTLDNKGTSAVRTLIQNNVYNTHKHFNDFSYTLIHKKS